MKSILYHLLLLAVVAGVFRDAAFILYAAAVFTPLVETLPSLYGFAASPPNAMLLGLMAAFVLRPDRNTPPTPLRAPMLFWLATLIAGVVMLSTAASPYVNAVADPVASAKQAWYMSTPLLVYYLVYRSVSLRKNAEVVIGLCMLVSAGEAVLGLYERLQGVGRATAHLGEPNMAGAYFAGVSALFLAFVLFSKGRLWWFALAGWVVTVTGLFATLSRGGWLAAAVAHLVIFSVFLAQSRAKSASQKLGYIVILVLVAINAGLLVPQRVVDRVMFTFRGDESSARGGRVGQIEEEELDASSTGRLQLWRWGMQLFNQRKIGHGAFTSTDLVRQYRGRGKALHSIYLQVMVELGVQGIVALAILVFAVIRMLWRCYSSALSEREMALSLGLLGYWIALCISHAFMNPFFNLHLVGQFWIMAACVARHVVPREKTAARPSRAPLATPASALR